MDLGKHCSKLSLLFIILLFITFVFVQPCLSQTNEEENIPEWLKRVQFGFEAGTEMKPRGYFETVQPLYQDEEKQNTVFIQPRISYLDKATYNLGVGYRRLFDNNNVLLGTNLFYDYEEQHRHFRLGLGLETFIDIVELRSNAYFGLSPARVISTSGSQTEYQKAVDGLDFEVGIPLPYMNWVKVFASGFWYDYKKFDDKSGWQSRTEIKPFKYLTLNLITYDDNKGGQEFRSDVRFSIPWGYSSGDDEKICNIGISDKAYPDEVDHSSRVLDRVERQYTIEVERYVETASATIEIRRGD